MIFFNEVRRDLLPEEVAERERQDREDAERDAWALNRARFFTKAASNYAHLYTDVRPQVDTFSVLITTDYKQAPCS